MSDTPRTEAEVNRQKCWSDDLITVDANFACQLERELNAATSEIERLRKANLQLREGAEEQKQRIQRLEEVTQERDKEWFQVIESILGFHPVSMTEALRIGIERIKKQKQRIQRLEEAGDEMFKWSERVGQEYWIKAKEAKP